MAVLLEKIIYILLGANILNNILNKISKPTDAPNVAKSLDKIPSFLSSYFIITPYFIIIHSTLQILLHLQATHQ